MVITAHLNELPGTAWMSTFFASSHHQCQLEQSFWLASFVDMKEIAVAMFWCKFANAARH
jgi:hypothetical protein